MYSLDAELYLGSSFHVIIMISSNFYPEPFVATPYILICILANRPGN